MENEKKRTFYNQDETEQPQKQTDDQPVTDSDSKPEQPEAAAQTDAPDETKAAAKEEKEKEKEKEKDKKKKKKDCKAQLEEKEQELADQKDQYLRLMAEYQNYRNRTTEEKKKIYEAHDAAMWEKYGRGIHAHEDAETGKELSSKLFMSDKKRPVWDLDYMMEIGFSKVFALKDISDISRTSMERELNKLTPQFLVGGEK